LSTIHEEPVTSPASTVSGERNGVKTVPLTSDFQSSTVSGSARIGIILPDADLHPGPAKPYLFQPKEKQNYNFQNIEYYDAYDADK
jgi:hypothetical protein